MHEYMNQLVDGLKSEGIECSPAQAELLLKHLDLVIAKNKELNLTRIDSIEDGIYLHVIDSLLCTRKLSRVQGIESVLDLGTGGGFPGIPLAIMLDTKVTLLDSIQKKVSAVDGFIHALGLDDRCSAKCSRSEDLARTAPESFDLVVSRAVAQLNVLIEYASPLLATDGMLCALKANLSDDELATASASADICGMTIESQESFNLPQDYGHREILFIRKTGASSIPLPRRNGMATKRPLGIR